MVRINPPTAQLMLSDFVDLKGGDWVIQNVANSAVGRLLIVLAHQRGLRTVMARAPGLQGWTFRRCVEAPERYQVQIQWETLEAHMVGYRESPLAPEFRAIVMPFFAEAPDVRHFEELAQSAGVP